MTVMRKLTALKIKNLTEPGRCPDGNGLFLELNGKGSGRWLLRVQSKGIRRDFGLGSLKGVSLADARDAAFVMRKKIAQGIDPVEDRKQERRVIPTFRDAAKLVHEEHEKAWKNGKHQNQWIATLTTYAFPKIGDVPVDKIEGLPRKPKKDGTSPQCPMQRFRTSSKSLARVNPLGGLRWKRSS